MIGLRVLSKSGQPHKSPRLKRRISPALSPTVPCDQTKDLATFRNRQSFGAVAGVHRATSLRVAAESYVETDVVVHTICP